MSQNVARGVNRVGGAGGADAQDLELDIASSCKSRARSIPPCHPPRAREGVIRLVLTTWQQVITINHMETVTLKLDRVQIQKLDDHAKASGRSRAAVVRELIDRHLGDTAVSLHDRAKDLCGSVAGARDTSTRTPDGYGRD